MSPLAAGDRHVRLHQEIGDARLGPRLLDALAPLIEQAAIERGVRLARLGRHVGADIGLHRRLELAHLVDMDVDAELLGQALVIELAAARSHEDRSAHRVDPDLAGIGCDQVTAVDIARGIGKHRLARGADPADGGGDFAHRGGIAAEEAVEVQHDCLHARIGFRGVERADHVAGAHLAGAAGAAHAGEGIGLARLLDQRAVERHHQRAVANRRRSRPVGERGEQRGEEQEEQKEDEQVLDSDEYLPGSTDQLHRRLLKAYSRSRATGCAGPRQRPVLSAQYAPKKVPWRPLTKPDRLHISSLLALRGTEC
jgi:hypothetical protein